MRAIVYGRYGPPEVLEFKDVPTPTPKDNEVRIRTRAATGNIRCRSRCGGHHIERRDLDVHAIAIRQ